MRSAALLFATALVAACSGADVSNTCTVGEVVCQGNTLRACNAEGTGYTETICDVACINNACQACQAGATRCEGQLALTCNVDGSGWSQQTCPSGCDAASGKCKTQVCTPNQAQCSAGSVMTCKSDGSGYDITACPYGCDAATNACKTQAPTCTPNALSCNGAKLVTCNAAGTGITEQLCEFGCDAAATPNACKTAACAVDEKRCNPDVPKQVQTCKPDRTGWLNGTLCPGTCLNGLCQAPPACTVIGEQVCRQNVATHKDEIDECVAGGTWQTAKTVCTTGSCVDVGGTPKKFQCGSCWKDERSCSAVGDDIMQCTDPLAGPTKLLTCSAYDICLAGTCSSTLELEVSQLANYNILAQAFVDCWIVFKDSTENQMCFNIDGQSASASISFSSMKSWVCDDAVEADFYIPSDYTLAKDLVGCGLFNNSEIFWKWDPLPAGSVMEACIWYHPSGSMFYDDEDTLDHCSNFWLNP